MENYQLGKIFAEHYEILLQDIAAAMTNRKKSALKRCYYVFDNIIKLFSEIFQVSEKDAHKVLYNMAFPEKEKEFTIPELHEKDVDGLFRKHYRTQSSQLGADDNAASIRAASAACEIVTMFAELHSISYDEAAKRLNNENEEREG